MKKFTFFFALFAMLSFNIGIAKAETATISYAGGTTTNMTGNNDAALVGLDASLWSVVSDKGAANNHVGLNKAGNIRLYAEKASGNGNTLTVSISQGTIETITLDIKQTATYEVKAAGAVVSATEGTTYAIGATSFSIQNITTGESTQLHLNSITITYTSTGDNPGENPGDNPGGDDTATEVTISDLDYAMAFYEEEEGFAYWEIQLFNVDATGENVEFPLALVAIEAKSKTALNGTYDMLLALYGTDVDDEGYVDGVYMAEGTAAPLTINNLDNDGTYSFVGSFVGEDGKTYNLNTTSFMMWVEDGATGEAIELNENGGNDNPGTGNGGTAAGEVTFDADVDKGNATETQAPYEVTKDGVTMAVSSGRLGTYNNEVHYRIYKSQTLTLTSTVGNIVSVEFTCTGKDDAEYGPAHLTADNGTYTSAGEVGTWTGNAASVVFTAATAQVRASQIVVKIAGESTGVEDVTTVVIPVKVMQNGQLMIIHGENTYNVMGAQL